MPQNGASGRHSISLISREADRLPNIYLILSTEQKKKKEIKKRKERKIERKERMKKRRAHFCYSDKNMCN